IALEYIGEILNDKMADARGVQTQHLGRNYLFGLNVEWTIDAALVGNETRFINHATGNAANCKADVREVNGDHRIGSIFDSFPFINSYFCILGIYASKHDV
ncbi:hypothetical protein K439DRAFT_1335979, partial [Ramaria rubella]